MPLVYLDSALTPLTFYQGRGNPIDHPDAPLMASANGLFGYFKQSARCE